MEDDFMRHFRMKAEDLLRRQRRGPGGGLGLPIDGDRAGAAGTALIGSLLQRPPQSEPSIASPRGAPATGPANDPPPDPNALMVDRLWAALEQQESQGRQVDSSGRTIRSPKGASGIAQLMPGTAMEMAQLEGDPNLAARALADDTEANRRLGRRYLRQQLDDFSGDPVIALAAYNAGPGRVRGWLRKYGDPRAGDISSADWAANLPVEETREYVKSITTAAKVQTPAQRR